MRRRARHHARLYLRDARNAAHVANVRHLFHAVLRIRHPTYPDSKWQATIVAFIINYAAYFAEIYRSGLQSIPRGQYEAAEVLGYSKPQTFCYIVLPQLIKRIMPAIGNEVITLVKDTSLAFAIGVGEMFSTAKALVASQVSMVPFGIAAAIYWVFNFIVEVALGRIEKMLAYYHD